MRRQVIHAQRQKITAHSHHPESPQRTRSPISPLAMRTPVVQPKLTVNPPGDRYEQEADEMANRVMRMPAFESEGAVQAKAVPGAGAIGVAVSPKIPPPLANPKSQPASKTKELEQPEEAISETPQLQMMPAFSSAGDSGETDDNNPEQSPAQFRLTVGKPGDVYEQQADRIAAQVMGMPETISQPAIQRQKEAEEPEIQPQSLVDTITPLPPPVQRKETQGNSEASSALESRLNSSQGRGAPLSDEVRSFMEPRFRADFSQVRTHTDSSSAEMNKELHSQAFTHGSNIYFGDSKAPGKNDLTAHELTHTVQQGASKGSAQKKILAIQRVGKNTDVNEKTPINDLAPSKKGSITTGPNIITLFNFELKSYAANSPHLSGGPYEKPKGERPKTDKHKKSWETEVKDSVFNRVKSLLKGSYDEAQLYEFYVKGERQGVAIVGTIKEISKEMIVPPIDRQGKVRIFDVEHIIDWQILGGTSNVDEIENLLLLDASSNRGLGTAVKNQIKNHITSILNSYRDRGGEGVPKSAESAESRFKIEFKNFTIGSKLPGIFLRKENLTTSKDNPITSDNFVLKRYILDGDHFLLKTSAGRASYELPYSSEPRKVGSYEIEMDIVKEGKNKKLKGLNFTPLPQVRGIKAPITVKKSKIIIPDEQEPNVYKIDSAVLATNLKSLFGFRHASPIVLDDKIQTFPLIGQGKVVTNNKFLEGIDIGFDIDDDGYRVYAAITSDKFSGKFPKPFSIDSCSLILAASNSDGFSFSGLVAFSLGKFGSGEMVASVAEDGFALKGDFDFNAKYFNPAQISVAYRKGEWRIGGRIGIQQGLIPGIKDATLEAHYSKDTFSIAGLAHLSVPGIDTIKLAAQFDDKDNFAFTADVDLKAMKGIKSGNVKVTIASQKGEEDIKLRVEGKASPDFPSVPNLNAELSVLYDNGIFKVETTVQYKKGRFAGTINLGVTNQSVDDKGNPQGAPSQKGEVVVFGFGQLTVEILKGVKGAVQVRLTPEKEVLLAGQITLERLSPFGDGVNYDKTLLKFPELEIPLVGIPGLSVSAFITGGTHFKFNWQPLMLKILVVKFEETNINELENARLNITGSIGSSATAEVYMAIEAGLKARLAIIVVKGSLGGEAGLGVTGEAGGSLEARWDMEKGLQLKEIMAYLDVAPKAIFRLTGQVSVDLDLWLTSFNLYYHKWILAEKALDLSGLTLKARVPLRFDPEGKLIKPNVEDLVSSLEKPDFTGDQGKKVLDGAINADAEKELAAKKEEIRTTVRKDLRDAEKDLTPTKYTEKMKKKYEDLSEFQEFVVQAIKDEARLMEYELFEKLKNTIRQTNVPLDKKISLVNTLKLFYGYVTDSDFNAFKAELVKIEADKKLKAEQERMVGQEPSTPGNVQGELASNQKSNAEKKAASKALKPSS
jgi:hypothetical protein